MSRGGGGAVTTEGISILNNESGVGVVTTERYFNITNESGG